MLLNFSLDDSSGTPLYRQLSDKIRELIDSGALSDGARLPATRELAGSLGLNRTTVSAAYELLEAEGLLKGHVGRGSFVKTSGRQGGTISFSSSRPSESLFPLEAFRETCTEVIQSEQAPNILQLGSPSGYGPLRRYLLDRAKLEGSASESDDILITSGCQQAYDLLQRTLLSPGETVVVEDPVIPGLRNALRQAGVQLIGVSVGPDGIDLAALESVLLRDQPRMLMVTPNFQNPTGATLPLERRQQLLEIAHRSGTLVVENDIYGDLRYEGNPLPKLKQLDRFGQTILLRSFSKLAFPGLRVGWVVGPRQIIERMTESKQWSDLHTDQLSQAILCRFAETGRLDEHRSRILKTGFERLRAAVDACEHHLPPGSQFTRPEGGMNLWVRLPEPLDSGELLPRAEREGVSYLPGKFFGVSQVETGSLRISFAGVDPKRIELGIAKLGKLFQSELDGIREHNALEAIPAMV